MAQKTVDFEKVGTVVKHERKSGSFTNDRGEPVVYDFVIGRMITSSLDVYEVRFPSDGISVRIPKPNELVRVSIEARPAGGDLRLTAKSVVVVGESAIGAALVAGDTILSDLDV